MTTNKLQNLTNGYEEFKQDWYNRPVWYKLLQLAYYYPLHWYRMNYYYYFDKNKYTTYMGLVYYIKRQDKTEGS